MRRCVAGRTGSGADLESNFEGIGSDSTRGAGAPPALTAPRLLEVDVRAGSHKSLRQVEELLAARFPKPDVKALGIRSTDPVLERGRA